MTLVWFHFAMYFVATCAQQVARRLGHNYLRTAFCIFAVASLLGMGGLPQPYWLGILLVLLLGVLIWVWDRPLLKLYWMAAVPFRRHIEPRLIQVRGVETYTQGGMQMARVKFGGVTREPAVFHRKDEPVSPECRADGY